MIFSRSLKKKKGLHIHGLHFIILFSWIIMGNFLSACYSNKCIAFRLFQTIWPLLHPRKMVSRFLTKPASFLNLICSLKKWQPELCHANCVVWELTLISYQMTHQLLRQLRRNLTLKWNGSLRGT